MKKYACILFCTILFSCAEKSPKDVAEKSLTPYEVIQQGVINKSKDRVPSYNFEELNTFLTKDNDSTYVINFWATWCKPCIKEIPAFEKLQAEYSEKKLKVILVSLDFPEKLDSQVIPFIEKNMIQSQVFLLNDDDANSWIPRISKEWSGAIPATLIYNNTSRHFYERSFTFEELETELSIIL